jgi:CHASE3 domain sensor protein
MPELIIDLEERIKKLKDRCKDLRELMVDPPGPTADEKSEQREQIAEWLSDLNEEKLALKRILDHQEASKVTLQGLNQEEYQKINQALVALSEVIEREQTFNEIILTVTAILEGTNTLIGKL